jgi:hypothetical protein
MTQFAIKTLAPNQRPLWLPGFVEVLGTSAATQFMGEFAAVADVQAHKTRMRTLQAAYFAQRSVERIHG